ncbi:TAXI family TRAP transporter solute-binding subunit [Phytoactinopolyspora mesophila]|uniref:TAXI family TRAP transporter solute-binding subunit n=1 Tax=Phytoactinopolyspora mesophila TaxID=2650750 RepID=UPI001C9E7A6F
MRNRRVSRRSALLGLAGVVLGGSTPALLSACTREATLSITEIRLATGPAGAVYRRIGGGLADILDRRYPSATVTAVPSHASTDNIRMLLEDEVHLGLANLDAAVGLDAEPPAGIAALCRLYDSHLHLAVLADSPIRTVGDLEGRRVSYGAEDSGTDFTSRRLIDLTGIGLRPVWLDQAESARALAARDIDATFSLTGVPTPAISDLAERRPIRLIPMPQEADALADAYPGPYFPATIPATAYHDVPACPTLAIPNVLLARTDLPVDVAKAVTEAVFTEAPAIASDVPEATQINVRTGIATGPIPLHPGAAEWFRDQKR